MGFFRWKGVNFFGQHKGLKIQLLQKPLEIRIEGKDEEEEEQRRSKKKFVMERKDGWTCKHGLKRCVKTG